MGILPKAGKRGLVKMIVVPMGDQNVLGSGYFFDIKGERREIANAPKEAGKDRQQRIDGFSF